MLLDSNDTLFDPSSPTGFPSPAADFAERALDLNEHLIQNKPATYFMYSETEAMVESGIFLGSLLIVDRSLPPSPGHIIVSLLNGAFYLRRLWKKEGAFSLHADNLLYEDIPISEDDDFTVWGVVTTVIQRLEGHGEKSLCPR